MVARVLIGALREEVLRRHVWVGTARTPRASEIARDHVRRRGGANGSRRARGSTSLSSAVPDAIADPWFRLAFAHMQVHAIRESGAEPQPLANGLAVRQGGVDDLRAALPLLTLIWEHHTASPTFTGLVVPDAQAFLADWEETLLEYDCVYFVAELEGRIVGHLALYPERAEPRDASRLGCPGLAATLPEARGLGAEWHSRRPHWAGLARPGTTPCTRTGGWPTSSRRASGLGEASGRPSTGSRAASRSADRQGRRIFTLSPRIARHLRVSRRYARKRVEGGVPLEIERYLRCGPESAAVTPRRTRTVPDTQRSARRKTRLPRSQSDAVPAASA